MASGQINDNQDVLIFEQVIISGQLEDNQDVLIFEGPPGSGLRFKLFAATFVVT